MRLGRWPGETDGPIGIEPVFGTRGRLYRVGRARRVHSGRYTAVALDRSWVWGAPVVDSGGLAGVGSGVSVPSVRSLTTAFVKRWLIPIATGPRHYVPLTSGRRAAP